MEFSFWHVTAAILVPGVLLGSWIDYAERRVPNWFNLALILIGFTAQAFFYGTSGVVAGFWGLLTGFGLLIVPWLMHGMGAGDVKLMAAIGVWLGPRLTLYSFALGAMIGGLAAVIMILSSGRLRMACNNLGVILAKCSSRDTIFAEVGSARSFGSTTQLLPYGVPLTAGTLLVLGAKWVGGWGI
jgi:prepilin peptidase CpaA